MRADPPAELVDLLERLGLASAAEVAAVERRVRKLANDLPLFPSIWVDALVQARKLTPFQAAEINAGRGERLAVGPYVLSTPVSSLGYADCFRAIGRLSKRSAHLLVCRAPANIDAIDSNAAAPGTESAMAAALTVLVERLATMTNRHIVQPDSAGADAGRAWLASSVSKARSLSDILGRTGRLTGKAVLEIARQMVSALAVLEPEFVYGDLSPRTVSIDERGWVRLDWSGVRNIVRPNEDFSQPDMRPDAYDYLAPERAFDNSSPDVASDLFACGCLWWHLATGRPPFGGGTSRRKIHAAKTARILDVKLLAPEAPAALLAAITACVKRDPRQRPKSFQDLADMLGAAMPSGRRILANVYSRIGQRNSGVVRSLETAARSRDARAWMATIAGCVAVAMAVGWPLLHAQTPKTDVHSLTRAAKVPSGLPASSQGQRIVAAIHRPSGVVQASYAEPTSNVLLDGGHVVGDLTRTNPQTASQSLPPLILPADQPVAWSAASLALHPGQTVRGRPGERPLIIVPPSGLVVVVEDVRFENVDFVWQPASDAPIDPERAMLIDLRAARASFSECTFQAAVQSTGLPVAAICWSGPRPARSLPPAGRLKLRGCVFCEVASGVAGRLSAPLEINIENSLFLGPGPVLRFDHAPRADEPMAITLANCTLRDAAGLVCFQLTQTQAIETGNITITTNDCVLSPDLSGALALFAGSDLSAELPKAIQWSGQGSVLRTNSRLAARVGNDGHSSRDEIEMTVDGLVSGPVEFVGPSDAGSSASRITHWLAPAQSAEPPGICENLPNTPSLGRRLSQ